MGKRERKKEFINSLSEDQKSIYKLIRKGVHRSKESFHKSYNKHQKKNHDKHTKLKKEKNRAKIIYN